MKNGWEIKKLGSLFNVKSSRRVHKSDWRKEGIPFYRAREVVKLAQNGYVENDLFISDQLYQSLINGKGCPSAGDIIVSAVGTLGECYLVKESDKFYFKDASVLWLEKTSQVHSRYIEYAFKSKIVRDQIFEGSMGATVGTLPINKAKNLKIPVPPLPEQKQIISILDRAFAAIDKAKANVERNLQNAKELFQSKKVYLFNELASECDLKPIGDVCEKIFAGGDKPKENFSKEPTEDYTIPIIANAVKDSGLYGYTNEARVTRPSITVAARGSGTGHTEFRNYPFVPIVRLIVLTPDSTQVDVGFLMHAIKNLTILRSGSAIPQLTVPMMKGYSIPVPSLEQQAKTVASLNKLHQHVYNYTDKLKLKLYKLEELKKSILQKAFAGELTTEEVEVSV